MRKIKTQVQLRNVFLQSMDEYHFISIFLIYYAGFTLKLLS